MSENRFNKYLLYAFGEIVLVVIGILIALKINTWNENNKTDQKTIDLLQALKSDLILDTLLIHARKPHIIEQYNLNESLRARVARSSATEDTLLHIVRHEFNPSYGGPIYYNLNSYNTLNETGLIERLSDSMKLQIVNYYNTKLYLISNVEKTTHDYRGKVTSYTNTYTFGSLPIHDQGPLIDELVWEGVDLRNLAATFNGISNFRRILFAETKAELEYSLVNARILLKEIDNYIIENS